MLGCSNGRGREEVKERSTKGFEWIKSSLISPLWVQRCQRVHRLVVMGPQVAEPGCGATGRGSGGVALGGGRVLVRLGEGRSIREAAGATSGTAPNAGRMVGKLLLLLLLRVMLREASIGGEPLLLVVLLMQVLLAL